MVGVLQAAYLQRCCVPEPACLCVGLLRAVEFVSAVAKVRTGLGQVRHGFSLPMLSVERGQPCVSETAEDMARTFGVFEVGNLLYF
mmetsp:Transcript_23162/g.58507  ORF Transcript_23162/g.58507 Transcript_23162/m.58507 type:complete len:86 (+) Transcript_23162:638-895(+)